MSKIEVTHNPAASRFEIERDGLLAVLDYQLEEGRIVLVHTKVPPELEGGGLGSALAQAGLEYARAEGLMVSPLCPFVKLLKRHPEYADVVEN